MEEDEEELKNESLSQSLINFQEKQNNLDPDVFNTESDYSLKQIAKQQVKKRIKRKFKIGDIYYLKTKSFIGKPAEIKEFKLVKFIYTINENPVNILILKQISGRRNMTFTLSRTDCTLFHVKYENDLQVWSMDLNWIHKKDKNK